MKTMKFLFSIIFLFTALNSDAQLILDTIVSGVNQPVDITHAGDERIFVTQRRGRITILENEAMLPTPFLNISSLVSGGLYNERGLLGMVFHPDYAGNGYFYVNYTKTNGDTRISRFKVSSDPNVADAGSELMILEVSQPFWNHNGGGLKFGPDGYLYIGFGDGGGQNDPNGNGQNPQSLLGKMLRIDVDNGSPYDIPASNPFVGNDDVLDEIWAIGLRNPWRFSFDSETGDLWIGDVGQNDWEEIDYQLANSTGGENYGWKCFEGTHEFSTTGVCSDPDTLINPAFEYSSQGFSSHCSVTGGFVYRGCINPDFVGHYIYADYCTGVFWSMVSDGQGGWTNTQVADYGGYDISTFGEDVHGELYVAQRGADGSNKGVIYKISSTTAVTVEITTDVNALMAPSGYATYQWYLDNQIINGANSQIYDATEAGIYTVEVTTNDDCTFVSEQYGHTLVGVNNIPSLLDFQLNPNPFADDLEVSILVNESTEFTLILLDLDGKKIVEENISVSTSFSKVLNLEKLPSAVYFLILESENGRIVKRIVKN